jgi:hypothetical protein
MAIIPLSKQVFSTDELENADHLYGDDEFNCLDEPIAFRPEITALNFTQTGHQRSQIKMKNCLEF